MPEIGDMSWKGQSALKLGLRHEHVSIEDADGPAVQAKVTIVESTGDEVLVLVDTDSGRAGPGDFRCGKAAGRAFSAHEVYQLRGPWHGHCQP